MPKISIEKVKKTSPKTLLKIIQRAKDYLKTNDVFMDMCKEHGVDIDFIDLVPVKFGDLEVSARTDRAIITLSWKLLCDGDFFKNYSYLVHEILHFMQQCFGDGPTKGATEGDYLHNKFEQDAFKDQIQYINDQFGENEAENYVEHLLDHHDKDGKERKNLKEKLEEKL